MQVVHSRYFCSLNPCLSVIIVLIDIAIAEAMKKNKEELTLPNADR